MPNENKKLSAEEVYNILGEGYGFNGKKEDAVKLINDYAAQQTASLEAEVKRREFEAMERRADLQDLEDENDDLLSKTERLDVEVKRLKDDVDILEAIQALAKSLRIDYEALKLKADRLCEALKTIVSGDIGPIGLHKAQQAITNYEKQE